MSTTEKAEINGRNVKFKSGLSEMTFLSVL